MQRIAIILNKNLDKGQVGNISCIFMGQAAICHPEIYDSAVLLDKNENRHAAIRYSTVLLKANGQGQLLNLVKRVHVEYPSMTCVLFSQVGQGLHNAFGEYQRQIVSSSSEELTPVGVLVLGDEENVRLVTKKFSLLK